MDGSIIDIVIFAALAPIFGVMLFWFIQLLFIESQKYFLSLIEPNHDALIKFSNFLGILFQTICHALGYTLTKSGISGFYVSVNYGKVSPKRIRKGVLEWISNAFLIIGPFFFPSVLLLLCLFFLVNSDFFIIYSQGYTFSDNLISFGLNLYNFSTGFLGFIFSMDLLNPVHLGFLIFLIFMGLGIRPSFIGEKNIEKVDMIYDLKKIRYNILHKPIYIILLLLLSYIIFYLSILIGQNYYIAFFTILGWLSIISIVSLTITHMIILMIKFTDNLPYFQKFLVYFTIPFTYIVFRIIFYYFPISIQYSISLLLTVSLSSILIYYLLKIQNNKYKKQIDMASLSKLGKGLKDDSRRIIRK